MAAHVDKLRPNISEVDADDDTTSP